MQAVSGQSLAAVVAAVDAALDAGADPATMGEELFGLAALLDDQPALRRLLTDPGVEADRKADLVRSLLRGRVSESAAQVMVVAGGRRWAAGRDLANALEQAGVTAHVAQAERDGQLEDLEDELFRFSRIVEGEPALREALGDRTAPASAKRTLLDALLGGRASDPAQRLLAQAITGRHRSFFAAVAAYQRIAAARRNRLVATVRVAASLSEQHKQRLARALQGVYGHDVHLNVIVEPPLLGGARVTVGDEVIDSTVATRLADARRRLVG